MTNKDMEQYIEVLLALGGYGYTNDKNMENEIPPREISHKISHEIKETAQPCVL